MFSRIVWVYSTIRHSGRSQAAEDQNKPEVSIWPQSPCGRHSLSWRRLRRLIWSIHTDHFMPLSRLVPFHWSLSHVIQYDIPHHLSELRQRKARVHVDNLSGVFREKRSTRYPVYNVCPIHRSIQSKGTADGKLPLGADVSAYLLSHKGDRVMLSNSIG